jgi:hypothetical protein
MWETPIYKFKTKINNIDSEIKIDVTGSAPNFIEPGKQLEGTFNILLEDLNPKNTNILDFGAAKLRNTLFLLKKGYNIYSCEFEDLFNRSDQAKNFLSEAQKYDNFHPLIFPKDFINTEVKFDVILMINVLNIMPVVSERLLVLELCRKRIKNNGRFLWYTQHGAYDYNKAVCRLFDGIVTGSGRKYQMFYKDYAKNEIIELLNSTGFEFENTFKFPSSGSNQAYMFKASGGILIENALKVFKKDKKLIKSKYINVIRKSKKKKYSTKEPIIATDINAVKNINFLIEYCNQLKMLKPGKKDAKKYEDLIFNILRNIFESQLRNGKVQVPTDKRIGIIDIIFDNKAKSGFFYELKENHQIKSPYIYFECKNYKEDPVNTEINQLSSRLSELKGMFGVLVYRKVKNPNRFSERCEKEMNDNKKFIIGLTDVDIIKLVELKTSKKEEEINDYLSEKLKKLILRQ